MGGDSVTLDWTKPRSDGGSTLTGYVIERRDAAATHWTRVASVDQRRTSFTLTNLRPGAEYQLQVLAENDIGVSDPCTLPAPVRMAAAPPAGMLTAFTTALPSSLSLSLSLSQFLDTHVNRYTIEDIQKKKN